MNNGRCKCPACQALNARYANDPELLAFYRKRLLVRRWPGNTNATEKVYIRVHSTWGEAVAQAGSRTLALARKAPVGKGHQIEIERLVTRTQNDEGDSSDGGKHGQEGGD